MFHNVKGESANPKRVKANTFLCIKQYGYFGVFKKIRIVRFSVTCKQERNPMSIIVCFKKDSMLLMPILKLKMCLF